MAAPTEDLEARVGLNGLSWASLCLPAPHHTALGGNGAGARARPVVGFFVLIF